MQLRLTLAAAHYGSGRFPYTSLYVALLVGQALAMAALVIYSP